MRDASMTGLSLVVHIFTWVLTVLGLNSTRLTLSHTDFQNYKRTHSLYGFMKAHLCTHSLTPVHLPSFPREVIPKTLSSRLGCVFLILCPWLKGPTITRVFPTRNLPATDWGQVVRCPCSVTVLRGSRLVAWLSHGCPRERERERCNLPCQLSWSVMADRLQRGPNQLVN